jgi:release factor glutamine methyltransferase
MNGTPYLASDDSALLREAITGYSGYSCLEIGAGNAGNLTELAKSFDQAVGTELVKPNGIDWKGRGWDIVLADRATCFRDEVFDLVAFNPPYLPSETIEDIAVDGGEGGTEVPLLFLQEALRVVKKDGRIVMLLSSQNSTEEIRRECSRKNFTLRSIASKELFFERLYAYEASSSTP